MLWTIHLESDNPGDRSDVIFVYTLEAAGGPFLDNQDARRIGWALALSAYKSSASEYFICKVIGPSMEPTVPSGSYILGRHGVAGSRFGRTVLVEERKLAECAYTLKMYGREPQDTEDRERSGRILLKSKNPDQPDIEIDESGQSWDGRYQVVGEFVRTLTNIKIVKPLLAPDEFSQEFPPDIDPVT